MVKRDSRVRLAPKGLRNKGNDCFFNSGMQCLLSVVALSTFYSTESFGNSQRTSRDFQDFIQNWKGAHETIVPEDFIRRLRPQIKILDGKQQDSHEFLLSFTNLLFREISPNGKEVYSTMDEFEKIKAENVIADTFYGMLQTSITCNSCLKRFKCMHHFSTLSLNVSPTLNQSLRLFSQESVLENNNKWKCGNCGLSKSSKHKIEVIEFPKTLMIHLMRFDGGYKKDSREVQVEDEIVLNGHTYEIFGIVCHSGVLNSGHYIAYAKRIGTWYCFNDENVGKVAGPPLKNSNAYLIFYMKK